LLAKVKTAQADFGGTWQKAIEYLLRLGVVYGGLADEDYNISLMWANPSMRDELAEAQTLAIHQAAGVPQKMIWRKLGYSDTEIEEMEAMIADQNNEGIIAAVPAQLRGVEANGQA
jgi:hypothetical protein